MIDQKRKIYLFTQPVPNWGPNDVLGFALAEDGECLATHLSSNVSYSQHDMGLTSNWKHDEYKAHYPDGFELEWVDNLECHAGFQAAYAKNQAMKAAFNTLEKAFGLERK